MDYLQNDEYRQEILHRDCDDYIAFHEPRRMYYMPNMFDQPEDAEGWVELFENLKEDEELKDMAVSTNKRLGYLEWGLVDLEGKFIKRIEDCQNAKGNARRHLAQAYLLLGLCRPTGAKC